MEQFFLKQKQNNRMFILNFSQLLKNVLVTLNKDSENVFHLRLDIIAVRHLPLSVFFLKCIFPPSLLPTFQSFLHKLGTKVIYNKEKWLTTYNHIDMAERARRTWDLPLGETCHYCHHHINGKQARNRRNRTLNSLHYELLAPTHFHLVNFTFDV